MYDVAACIDMTAGKGFIVGDGTSTKKKSKRMVAGMWGNSTLMSSTNRHQRENRKAWGGVAHAGVDATKVVLGLMPN